MQYELTIDKELESLCPALADDELRLLEESIAKYGCRDEITIWAGHNKTVIDGHNRYRICKKLGKTYKTASLDFKSKDEAKLWMLRNQMGRRNLNESQRGMLAAQMANLSHGQRKSDTQICVSQSEAAAECGVSTRTVSAAKQVIANGTPALQKLVTDGDVSVSAAAEVATLPKEEQKKVVAKGAEAVAKKAKEKRTAKKASGVDFGDRSRGKPDAKPEADEKPAEPVNDFLKHATKGETGSVTDGHGDEVTGELRHVFEICAEFKEKRQALTNLKTWITQRVSHPGCAVLASGESRIKTDIDNLDIELKFATPYCACVYCKNKMPKVANCTACKGRGWITQEIYKQAPKELKRA